MLNGGNVSVEPAVFIFKVEVTYVTPCSLVDAYHSFCTEDGDRSPPPPKFCHLSYKLQGVTFQQIVVYQVIAV